MSSDKIALERIKRAEREGSSSLDLSYNELKSLPPEISQLTNLTSLDLSYNQLSVLPPEIENLLRLETLDLENNKLAQLPRQIFDLDF